MKSKYNYLVDNEEEYEDDWKLPLSFCNRRHTEKIEGAKIVPCSWRMKERMKTVSVALVVCLNVGVDPPDIVKTQPCARLECWIDPSSMSPQKALETIGNNLQKQYERWQPRARYKQSLDPTVDEIKKLCVSLRRNAKDERVLFHYNGHGVPKPTVNGEIWVFNKTYTQYIPLSMYDLQTWMGSPSIYVYDCSNAGIIIDLFKQFAEQHEKEYQQTMSQGSCNSSSSLTAPSFKNCIQLAACSADQILPMNPDLPADIFTSCLTTPIKIALRWFVMQNSSKLVPKVSLDLIDKIPGQLNDRRTVLGELNWIFTAITDTIAWNILPKDLFQKLFRQDLLVASLFRNYLLAERIMRSYDCTPVSSPILPPTHQHPMWLAWDLSLDLCLVQLPTVLENENAYIHSPFFEEQLTAFEVWLEVGSEERSTPEQLPIVLQVLLSQVHRLRALELLSRFVDLGPWAVNLALSVGIFPYILKLLQSSARELRSLLVFIWAKILAVDASCQADLVRDNGHKYFLQVLQDPSMSGEYKTMAAFVMAVIVHEYLPGQEVALQGSLVSICLVQLNDPNVKLRQWLIICLARLWQRYDKARWCGVRDIAHEKLYPYLKDPVPEVRAAVVFALGTFMNTAIERTEHANNLDQSITMMLMNIVSQDMSPLVRKELVVALQWLIIAFENCFLSIASQEVKEWKDVSGNTDQHLVPVANAMRRNWSRERIRNSAPSQNVIIGIDCVSSPENILEFENKNGGRIKRTSSSTSISSLGYCSSGSSSSTPSPVAYGSFYTKLWQGLSLLDSDPFPSVSRMSRTLTDYIRNQAREGILGKDWLDKTKCAFRSLPPSPSNQSYLTGTSPPEIMCGSSADLNKISRMRQSSSNHKSIPTMINEMQVLDDSYKQLVSSQLINWCSRYFTEPMLSRNDDSGDTQSCSYFEREWRYSRNAAIRREGKEEQARSNQLRLENQVFCTKLAHPSSLMLLHPYDPHLVIAAKDTIGIWDYQVGARINCWGSDRSCATHRFATRITALEFVNPHDVSMLLVGLEDGSVELWSNYSNGVAQEPTLVTAWQALPEIAVSCPKNSAAGLSSINANPGIRICWDQFSQHLLVGGDARVIRVWDAETELKLQDISTGTESFVNTITVDYYGKNVFAVGCGDGSVRVFDRRLPPSSVRTMTYREHTGSILTATIKQSNPRTLIAGCVFGEIRTFDIRRKSSVLTCRTGNNATALAIHTYSNILACGTVNQVISLYNTEGTWLNAVRSHDWFATPKFTTPVSALVFHPHRVLLGYALLDSTITLCSLDAKRWHFSTAPY